MRRPVLLLPLAGVAFAGPAAAAAPPVGAIMAGIPIWVYPLFALLVYLGLQATRPREVALPRLLPPPGAGRHDLHAHLVRPDRKDAPIRPRFRSLRQ